jgi:hypothetical protein
LTPDASRRTLDLTSKFQSEAGWILGSQSVVVVVGNYCFTAGFTRVAVSSACTSGFAIHVESMSPPEALSLYRNEII